MTQGSCGGRYEAQKLGHSCCSKFINTRAPSPGKPPGPHMSKAQTVKIGADQIQQQNAGKLILILGSAEKKVFHSLFSILLPLVMTQTFPLKLGMLWLSHKMSRDQNIDFLNKITGRMEIYRLPGSQWLGTRQQEILSSEKYTGRWRCHLSTNIQHLHSLLLPSSTKTSTKNLGPTWTPDKISIFQWQAARRSEIQYSLSLIKHGK